MAIVARVRVSLNENSGTTFQPAGRDREGAGRSSRQSDGGMRSSGRSAGRNSAIPSFIEPGRPGARGAKVSATAGGGARGGAGTDKAGEPSRGKDVFIRGERRGARDRAT